MMHFDCRTEGIGWKLSLPTQRTVGAGHPIRSRTGAQEVLEELEESQEFGEGEELETPPASRPPTPPTSYRGGRVWTFTAKTLPMSVAVFCPKTVSAPKALDVLVYAHGHLSPCPPVPKTMPEDIITKAPFELGKIVDASNRHVALVVPFMDWGNLRKNKLNFEACNRDTMHALGVPANLNGVVREALGEIGRVYGTATPSLQHLILAGHSRAYDFLNPLAIAHVDPEMSRGCLARLSEVWALDTTYVCYVAEWMRWLSAKKPLRISVFYRPGTATAACGKKLAAAAARAGGRLVVTPVPEGHCQVPVRRLPALLNPTSLPAKEVAEEMGEMMEAQEEEALEEALVNESEETLDPEVAEVSSEMADEAFGSEVAGDAEAQDALASDEQAVGEGVP
jgi:hypothetical protein